jgi:hypothetical protein
LRVFPAFVVRLKSQHEKNKQLKNDDADSQIDNSSSSSTVQLVNDAENKSVHVSSSLSDQHPRPMGADRGKSCSSVQNSSKNRKKRNRRNQDRSSSSVTLDLRSTSCTAGDGETLAPCKKEKTKSSERQTALETVDNKVTNSVNSGTKNKSQQCNSSNKTEKEIGCKTSRETTANIDNCLRIPNAKNSGLN